MVTQQLLIQADPGLVAERSATLGYRPALDGLRAIFVLTVILLHSGLVYRIPFTRLHIMIGGFFGVDGFFVLSGFLITTLLAGEWESAGTISLRRFYLRRALRLLPALLLMLAACAIYAAFWAIADEAELIWRGVLSSLAYSANFLVSAGKNLHALVHMWSLSNEEQFYLLWPPALFGMLRAGWRRPTIVAVVVFLICAAAGWRAWMWTSGSSLTRMHYAPDMRADALLVGCLLGLFWTWRMFPMGRRWSLGLGCAASLAALYLGFRLTATVITMPQLYLGEMTLIAAAFAVVILQVVERPTWPFAWLLENRIAVWLGRVSYGLYLWHPPVMYIWRSRGPRYGVDGTVNLLAQALTLMVIVIASFYLIEQPCLRLKRK